MFSYMFFNRRSGAMLWQQTHDTDESAISAAKAAAERDSIAIDILCDHGRFYRDVATV